MQRLTLTMINKWCCSLLIHALNKWNPVVKCHRVTQSLEDLQLFYLFPSWTDAGLHWYLRVFRLHTSLCCTFSGTLSVCAASPAACSHGNMVVYSTRDLRRLNKSPVFLHEMLLVWMHWGRSLCVQGDQMWIKCWPLVELTGQKWHAITVRP